MKRVFTCVVIIVAMYVTSLAQKNDRSCTESVKINYDEIYETMSYPKWMFDFDISGYITAYGEVDSNGYMHDIIVIESYCDEFNDVATNALSTIKHRPAVRNCKPVSQKVFARVWIATKQFSKLPKVQLLLSNYNELKPSKSGSAIGRFYYQRGMQFFRMGEDSLAQIDYFQAIAELNGADLPYFDEAIYDEMKHLLPVDTERTDSLEYRAWLLNKFCLYAKTIACYDTLIARNQHDLSAVARYRFNQAGAYAQLKYFDLAIEGYLKYLSVHPQDAEALLNLGWNYYLAGNYDSCRIYTKKALDIKPDQMTARFNYALVHLRMGKSKEAVNLYKEAIILATQKKYNMEGSIEDILELINENIEIEVSKDLLINYFNVKEKSLRKLFNR